MTQVRFTAIRDPHITGTLGTTVEEYYSHFPELKGIQSSASASKRSSGLKELYTDENGNHVIGKDGKPMTKYKVAQQKAYETLQAIDPITGKRGYDLLGEKSGNTRKYTRDEYGISIGQYQAAEGVKTSSANKVQKNIYGVKTLTATPAQRYERVVEYFLEQMKLDKCVPKGVKLSVNRNNSCSNTYQVDHRYSISQGFENKVSPFLIASILNCELITWQQNMAKFSDCSITLEHLLDIHGYTQQQSEEEFNKMMTVIQQEINNKVTHSSLCVIKDAGLRSAYKFITDKNKGNLLPFGK